METQLEALLKQVEDNNRAHDDACLAAFNDQKRANKITQNELRFAKDQLNKQQKELNEVNKLLRTADARKDDAVQQVTEQV